MQTSEVKSIKFFVYSLGIFMMLGTIFIGFLAYTKTVQSSKCLSNIQIAMDPKGHLFCNR